MKKIPFCFILLFLFFFSFSSDAKVDLVTLPNRESVQLTIYNSADLTLVRESRFLTLKEGLNALQFSWANTLIDPTSLEMLPKAMADKIDILDLTFPARVKDLGLWKIQSAVSGNVPVAINYLTSGLSWRAFYLGTLAKDEKTMRLKGYVRVANHSGEDYENAQVRMIVGKVHLIDQIAALAQRPYPYGRPQILREERGLGLSKDKAVRYKMADAMMPMAEAESMSFREPKEIVKEGLSEYFLYTIEGKETIPHGWAKRLPSFDIDKIDVVNLYKYEEERYGTAVVRFLSFTNDKAHKLGETPIPGGEIKVFRTVDEEKHLSYEGQSRFKYIPVNEEVELNLGVVQNVVVEATLMDYKTEKYSFDRWRNIDGWEEVREYKVSVKNTREVPIKVEIQRNFDTPYWKVTNKKTAAQYEKVDKDTVKYTLTLKPRESKDFIYILRIFHGKRREAM